MPVTPLSHSEPKLRPWFMKETHCPFVGRLGWPCASRWLFFPALIHLKNL
jgi:hypothetical protein